MEEEITDGEFLIDRILHKMFEKIEGYCEFDNLTIEKLKILAKRNELKDIQQIIQIIKQSPGVNHENT